MQKLTKDQWNNSMRGWFAGALYNQMIDNPNIWVLTGDLGYGMLDKIRADFPERFVNTGAAEQSLIGIACGLSLENKTVFVYSISTFLIYRGFETIRNYVNHEKLNVKLIGGGRDKDYLHDGFSHWSEDVRQTMRLFSNIQCVWPENKEDIPDIVDKMIRYDKPYFISLRR